MLLDLADKETFPVISGAAYALNRSGWSTNRRRKTKIVRSCSFRPLGRLPIHSRPVSPLGRG